MRGPITRPGKASLFGTTPHPRPPSSASPPEPAGRTATMKWQRPNSGASFRKEGFPTKKGWSASRLSPLASLSAGVMVRVRLQQWLGFSSEGFSRLQAERVGRSTQGMLMQHLNLGATTTGLFGHAQTAEVLVDSSIICSSFARVTCRKTETKGNPPLPFGFRLCGSQ